MITAVGFVALAAAGAVARAEAGRRWNRHDDLPLGTLLVNLTGAFVLGAMSDIAGPVVTAVGVGGLGTYTTVSSFARDVLALSEIGRTTLAVMYAIGTLVLGVGAAWLGMTL